MLILLQDSNFLLTFVKDLKRENMKLNMKISSKYFSSLKNQKSLVCIFTVATNS